MCLHTCSDRFASNCRSIKGDWGLWDDNEVNRRFMELDTTNKAFTWHQRVVNAVFVRPWNSASSELPQCMRQCVDASPNCSGISLVRWFGRSVCAESLSLLQDSPLQFAYLLTVEKQRVSDIS